jgi:hypothetical protein
MDILKTASFCLTIAATIGSPEKTEQYFKIVKIMEGLKQIN